MNTEDHYIPLKRKKSKGCSLSFYSLMWTSIFFITATLTFCLLIGDSADKVDPNEEPLSLQKQAIRNFERAGDHLYNMLINLSGDGAESSVDIEEHCNYDTDPAVLPRI